ncbi:hypothetical protein K469DRAFT_609896, partial [Zopfia rhizophila CBS 207.26]
SYGTLLGSSLFQSFVGGIIAFRVLPRPQFSTLQKNIFPIYFALQSLTPVLLTLTYPAGFRSLLPNQHNQLATDRLSLTLIGTMLITGLINWAYVGPQTTEVMKLRKHQETRDGKKSYDPPPHSEEMKKLNKRFSMLHGISSLVNLVGIIATVWYGFVLGEVLRFGER